MFAKRSIDHDEQVVIALAKRREGFAVQASGIAVGLNVALPGALEQPRDLCFVVLIRNVRMSFLQPVVPIPRLRRDQLAIVEADREDLAFDDGQVEQIALGQLAERNPGDARVHMMEIMSKTPPDSAVNDRLGLLHLVRPLVAVRVKVSLSQLCRGARGTKGGTILGVEQRRDDARVRCRPERIVFAFRNAVTNDASFHVRVENDHESNFAAIAWRLAAREGRCSASSSLEAGREQRWRCYWDVRRASSAGQFKRTEISRPRSSPGGCTSTRVLPSGWIS
jgi:hypothetical protein